MYFGPPKRREIFALVTYITTLYMWSSCGLYNFTRIFISNCSSGHKKLNNNWHKDEARGMSAGHGVIDRSLLFLKMCGIVYAKSLTYGVLGPIGTYRIFLAYTNFRVTGDERYFVPINNVVSLMSNEESERLSPYILEPRGNMSYIPKPVVPRICANCGHDERKKPEEEQQSSS